MCRVRREQGSAIVELAFVLSTLLLMFLSAIELTDYLNDSQRVQMLAREAARHVFARCAKENDEILADICLIQAHNELSSFSGVFLPRTEFIFSIFKYNPELKTVARIGISGVDRLDKTPSGFHSRFVTGPLTRDEFSLTLPNEQKPLILVAEAYQIWRGAGLANIRDNIYGVSIY